MRINGNLSIVGQLKDVKIDNLAADPTTPVLSQMWFNTTTNDMKFYDGTVTHIISTGDGDLAAFLLLDGTASMVGELTLSSADQSASATTVAVSKGHLDTELALKQDNLTGATSNLVATNLDVTRVAVTDGSGKIVASTSVTSAEVELLAGVTSSVQDQLDGKESSLGYVPLDKAGDTMSGTLAMGNNVISGLGAPVVSTDAVRKIDLDTALSGLDFQPDVDGIAVDAVIDPTATPTLGDRYIIVDATTLGTTYHANFGTIAGVESGDIVEYDGAAFVVAYDVSVAGEGALVWDRNLNTFSRYDNTLTWQDFGGLSGVTAGVGLGKSGNNIFVNMGAGVVQLPSDEVGIDYKVDGGLALVDPVSGLDSVLTDGQLTIRLDGTTMSTTASGLAVTAQGITAVELDSSATTMGNGIAGGGGVALNVVTPASSGITVDATGVSVDDVEMRTRALYRDGVEAMTGSLQLSSNDQTAEVDTTAISKGHLDAAISTIGSAATTLETRLVAGYFLYSELVTPSVTHTVTHNMNNQFVQVSVVDASDEVVIPESISYTDANNLVVTFTNSETCRVIVTGLKV